MKHELKIKKHGKYQMFKINNLLSLWVNNYYSKSTIVIIMNAKIAFKIIPKLIILKRDNLSAYIAGCIADICIVEFDNLGSAKDWVYSIPKVSDFSLMIYHKGEQIKVNI